MRSTIKDDMLEALMKISINGPKVKERNGVVKESVQQWLKEKPRRKLAKKTATGNCNTHGSYNFRQTKFKDFSRRKTSFQGPMFIQYINIFVPFFTPKTLNSVITYFRFSNSSALVDEVSLCHVILYNDQSLAILLALTVRLRYRNKFEM